MAYDRIATRRRFLKTTAGVAAVTALSGCSGDGGDGGSDGGDGGSTGGGNKYADEITVFTWGGEAAEKFNNTYIKGEGWDGETFIERHGTEINHQTFGNADQLLSKIQAGTSDAHLIDHNNNTVYPGVQDGLWQPIRTENIPNLNKFFEEFLPQNAPFDPGEEVHHIPWVYGSHGAVYNTEQMDKPTSWDDIYTEEFKKKVAPSGFITAVVANAALEVGIDFNTLDENKESKMEEIWNRVERQNEFAFQWWKSGSTMQQLLTNESALAGVFWVGRVAALREDNGVPVRHTVPEEGASAWMDTWSVPTGVDDPERFTVERFMNYVYEEAPARREAEILPYAQPFEMENPPEVLQNNADFQNSDRLHFWDAEVLEANRKEWQKRFQGIIQA